MYRLNPFTLATAVLATPLTTRLALAVPDPHLRERAAKRLGRAALCGEEEAHPDQPALPVGVRIADDLASRTQARYR